MCEHSYHTELLRPAFIEINMALFNILQILKNKTKSKINSLCLGHEMICSIVLKKAKISFLYHNYIRSIQLKGKKISITSHYIVFYWTNDLLIVMCAYSPVITAILCDITNIEQYIWKHGHILMLLIHAIMKLAIWSQIWCFDPLKRTFLLEYILLSNGTMQFEKHLLFKKSFLAAK